MFIIRSFFADEVVVSAADARQDGYRHRAMRLLVVGIKHFTVVVRLPLPPLIIAFKRELL